LQHRTDHRAGILDTQDITGFVPGTGADAGERPADDAKTSFIKAAQEAAIFVKS
jgi:hypothetical protein